MSVLRRVLQAVLSGLLLALIAPPIAALTFLFMAGASDPSVGQAFVSSAGSVALLVAGAASASYLIGAIPAFLAGLALPALSAVLPRLFACAAAGCLGVFAYAFTFGSHLLAGPNTLIAFGTYAVPAFVGAAAGAFIAQRIERRHAEA